MKRPRNKLTWKRNSAAHYLRNADAIKAKVKIKRAEYKAAKRLLVLEALKSGCIDCPETDLVCLDFDHRDREQKTFTIAQGVNDGTGIERFKVELLKCDVRCANCHRRRTAVQLMWWKTKL